MNLKEYIQKPTAVAIISVAVILFLYSIGQAWALTLLLPLLFVFTIKFPSILVSLLSRYITSFLFVYGILQVGAIIQFFVLPQSSFLVLAIIVCILSVLLVAVLKTKKLNTYNKTSVISRMDIFALVCASFFVVPMSIFSASSNEVLASLAGLQGVDGVNHYIYISALSVSQHLDYVVGGYYPKGFHIATAFLENGVGFNTVTSTWSSNIRNYFVQYVILGGALLYGLYYLFSSVVRAIIPKKVSSFVHIGAAISIGIAVTAFYLSNFLYNGFLSYFYICLTIVFGMIYLLDSTPKGIGRASLADKQKLLIAFLIMCIGASMSWPLLTPILLLTAFLYFLYISRPTQKGIININNLIIVFLVLANLVSLYMQLKYSGSDGAVGLSLTGGLTIFHIPFVVAGILALASLIYKSELAVELRVVLQQIFLPLVAFVIIFALSQYLLLGEVRYYVIKTSFLLEILFVVLVAALVVSMVVKDKKSNWYSILSIPIIVVSLVGGLIAISGNPLQDLRNMARNTTGVALPANFKSDTEELTELSSNGLVDASNAVTMHVSDSKNLYTHMQDYYWSIAMSYDGTKDSFKSLNCGDEVYKILFRQDFSPAVQAELIHQINNCIELADKNGKLYYIVTDDNSEIYLKNIFKQENVIFK